MDTVTAYDRLAELTAGPAYGTVEFFAEMLGRYSRDEKYLSQLTIRLVDQALNFVTESAWVQYTDAERLTHARNVLAAAELVREEMRQAGQ